MINLTPKDHLIIKKILNDFLPTYKIGVFGSRIKNTAKSFSDIDLVIFTEKKLPFLLITDILEQFSLSSLSILVDLVDFSALDNSFQKIILKQYEEFK